MPNPFRQQVFAGSNWLYGQLHVLIGFLQALDPAITRHSALTTEQIPEQWLPEPGLPLAAVKRRNDCLTTVEVKSEIDIIYRGDWTFRLSMARIPES